MGSQPAPAPVANGQRLLQVAHKHIGEKYILGAFAPKDNAQWKGPWDCAEFVSWVVYQVSGVLYGCQSATVDPSVADAWTGHWKRDAAARGITISWQQAAATPGAALLRYPVGDLVGHVAFADGQGGTIEAHSTKRGVIASTVSGRRWDIGVLVPGIAYTQGQPLPPIQPPAMAGGPGKARWISTPLTLMKCFGGGWPTQAPFDFVDTAHLKECFGVPHTSAAISPAPARPRSACVGGFRETGNGKRETTSSGRVGGWPR